MATLLAWLAVLIPGLLTGLTLLLLYKQYSLQARTLQLLELDATLKAVEVMPGLFDDLDDDTNEGAQVAFLKHARSIVEQYWAKPLKE